MSTDHHVTQPDAELKMGYQSCRERDREQRSKRTDRGTNPYSKGSNDNPHDECNSDNKSTDCLGSLRSPLRKQPVSEQNKCTEEGSGMETNRWPGRRLRNSGDKGSPNTRHRSDSSRSNKSSESEGACGKDFDNKSRTGSNARGVDKFKKKKDFQIDPTVLVKRQKYIDYGKNTEGYRCYISKVPKHERVYRLHPSTPDKFQQCSRRSWDQQIKIWRRQLHLFDPPELQKEDDDDELEDPEIYLTTDDDSTKTDSCTENATPKKKSRRQLPVLSPAKANVVLPRYQLSSEKKKEDHQENAENLAEDLQTFAVVKSPAKRKREVKGEMSD